MMTHWITTTDSKRLRQWERVFGTAVLPVLHPRARFVTGEDGHSRPMYDLALSHLNSWQRERLAADVARRTQRGYADVLREIQARPSYPITAANCHVVVVEEFPEETASRPSLAFAANALRLARQLYGRLALAS
jgi:hypothetical protein